MSVGTIIRVAARGDGVTEDGRHVPFAAPGDTLAADGSIVPGPHHQPPPCRHFPSCGGCQLQHLDDISWSAFVADRVSTALAAQGLEADVRAPMLSPPRTRRRATLHAERRGRQVHLGFTEASSHRLVDLLECQVLAPELFALVQPLKGLLASLLPRSGRADVQLTLVDQGVDVQLKGVSEEGLVVAEALTAFAARHQLARLGVDDGFGAQPRWEPDPVTIRLGDVPVGFPAGGFLQATAEGEAALVGAVREAIGAPAMVADLFAGLGTFAFALSGAKVYAAEAARDAIVALKAAAGRAQRPVFAEHRDLYRRPVTAAELSRFGAVVIDPPRAGAADQVAEIARSTVPLVAHISCNPSTFARDAKILCEGGYRLDWVQPVGQFRWSTHVELAARFSRTSVQG
jgi:23S rRNA (uracil1939-C5)-methyltransferase